VSFGGGLRAGVEWAVMPNVRLGIAGSTPIWMQKFDKYSGLFAEQGGFDIPASLQAGVAIDLTPAVTIMADYKHIWYSSIDSVSNPATNYLLGPSGFLGTDNGTGFGWRDVDIFKFGIEWRASPSLMLRGGYSYNTQPLQSRDVMFNILAPGVIQHHITAGAQFRLTQNMDLEFAAMYAPETSVRGLELSLLGPAAQTVELSMYQFEITAGIKYRFGGGEPPLK
jgi:long-chain fatty acid transport protein